MKSIPVRSVEPLRRLADDFGAHFGFPRHQILRAIAACLGYPAWEALIEAISPSAPDWIRDQDLTADELSMRRVEQARSLASVLALPFADSIEIAQGLAPTRDFHRPHPGGLFTNDAHVARAQLDFEDEWWVCSASLLHPLAPTGWHIGEIVNLADRARQVSRYRETGDRICLPDFSLMRRFSAVLPPDWRNHPWAPLVHHPVVRRDQALCILPAAWAFVFTELEVPTRFPSDFAFTPFANRPDALKQVAVDLERYKQLRDWATSASVKVSEGLQYPASIRSTRGVSPFWPLTPLIENDEQAVAWRGAEDRACGNR